MSDASDIRAPSPTTRTYNRPGLVAEKGSGGPTGSVWTPKKHLTGASGDRFAQLQPAQGEIATKNMRNQEAARQQPVSSSCRTRTPLTQIILLAEVSPTLNRMRAIG